MTMGRWTGALLVALLLLVSPRAHADTSARCGDEVNLACANGAQTANQDVTTLWNFQGSATIATFDGATGDTNKITFKLSGDPGGSFDAIVPHDGHSGMAKDYDCNPGEAATAFDHATGVTTCGAVGGSTVAWDDISDPTDNLALSMGNNTSTFTSGTATGSDVNVWVFKDTTGNTGTGYLFDIHTVGTSTLKPLLVAAGGTTNGVEMTTAGLLQPVGSGGIKASSLVAGSSGALAGAVTLQVCTATPCTLSPAQVTPDHALVFVRTLKFRRVSSSPGINEYTLSGTTLTFDASANLGSGADSAQVLILS